MHRSSSGIYSVFYLPCLTLLVLFFFLLWQELPGHSLPDATVDQGARLHRGPSEAEEGDGEAATGVHEPQDC